MVMNFAGKLIEIDGTPHYLERATKPNGSGILLIPHVYGIDEFIRGFAAELAERGRTTLVWNPYPQVPIGEKFGDKRPPKPSDGSAMKQLHRCVDVLVNDVGVTSLGTLGFCMGARWILIFGAEEPRLTAAVAAYPSVPTTLNPGQDIDPVATAAKVMCPIQVLCPGSDSVTPRPMYDAVQAALQTREIETATLYYPKAGHGFMHIPSPENDAAHKVARPQVHAFFDAHL
jgi:carboxymethylenebutenolidase